MVKIPGIAVIGPPASGKGSLVKPYQSQVVGLGDFAHALPDDHPLKRECKTHWDRSEIFSLNLVEKLLAAFPIPDAGWVLFDGGPRYANQVLTYENIFDVRGYVRVVVNDEVWPERAASAAAERSHRHDSSVSQLRARKIGYERDFLMLQELIRPIYVIDNSGNLADSKEEFEDALKEMLGDLFDRNA